MYGSQAVEPLARYVLNPILLSWYNRSGSTAQLLGLNTTILYTVTATKTAVCTAIK